jgi:hypothetical protein
MARCGWQTAKQSRIALPRRLKTADLVLGQQDFDTAAWHGSNEMWDPSAVRCARMRGLRRRAREQARHLLHPLLASGMAATRSAVPPEKNGPSGIDFDPTQEGIWITNEGTTLDLWDEDLNNKNAEVGSPGDGNVLGDASARRHRLPGDLLVAIGIGDHSDDGSCSEDRATRPPTRTRTRCFQRDPEVRTSRDFVGSVPGVEWSGAAERSWNRQPTGHCRYGRILFWNNPDPATMSNRRRGRYLDWLSCNYANECQPVISGFNDSDGAGCAANVSDNHLVAMSRVRDDPDRILSTNCRWKPCA